MKRRILCFIMIALILSGCSNQDTQSNKKDVVGYKIYYINNNETKIVTESYKPVASTKEELIREYITALSTAPENITYKKTLPDSILVKDFNLDDKGQLTLNFSSNYSSLEGIGEILCRAAIVKTLSQVEGVEYVEFNINNQPLMNSYEKPIGLMMAEDFIDNAGEGAENYSKSTVTLFFANKKGDKLLESNIRVTYDGIIPIEQLIVEQLIKGPIEEFQYPTISSKTSLIKVTTKESVCYVDFSEEFLDKLPDITDEVAIYSIVNSLVESPNVNKVQFLVNGEIKKTYREVIDLDGVFERNLDLVETK